MKPLSTKVHGFIDYTLGFSLPALPWLMDFNSNLAPTLCLSIAGAMLLLVAFFTHYEWGKVKTISMGGHLVLDCISGLLLMLSPWMFGFSAQLFIPHLLAGSVMLLIGLFSERSPYPLNYPPEPIFYSPRSLK